jgi:hypothetical protein
MIRPGHNHQGKVPVKGAFGRSRELGFLVSLSLGLVAILLLVGASSRSADVLTSLLSSGGSALLSVAVVGVLYDLVLRGTVAQEVLRIARLQQNLADAGVQNVCWERDVPWRVLLEDARNFDLILIDDMAWVSRDWQAVVDAAIDRPIAVRVYIPDSDGPDFLSIAARLGKSTDELRAIVNSMAQTIEQSWRAAKTAQRELHSGSQIDVIPYRGLPAYSLLRADANVVMVTPSALGGPSLDRTAFVFKTDKDRFPGAWFHAQLRTLSEHEFPPVYSDVASKA